MSNNGTGRTRSYATVVYPESAPDFLEKLNELKVPCFVSPLHDKDINPTGEPKKPHYHVLFCFESVKSETQAREMCNTIGGVGCEKVNSMRGYARYLCHYDNPEKAQYDCNEVKQLFGADYQSVISLNSDRYGLVRAMTDYICINHVHYFNAFFDYCKENNEDWYRSLCDSTGWIIKEYIKSFAYEDK